MLLVRDKTELGWDFANEEICELTK